MKETLRICRDTLRYTYRLDRTALLTMLFERLIAALKPYIAIFLSAYVLDGLMAGTAPAVLAGVAVRAVAGAFALGALERYLGKVKNVHVEIAVYVFEMSQGRKTLEMDYEMLDSPVAGDLRNRIANDRNWGAGFYSVYWQLNTLVETAAGLVAAAVVVWPLFTAGDLFAGGLPLAMFAGLIALTVASTLFQTRYVHKRSAALMDEAGSRRDYASLFLWKKADYRTGKDIRMYNASGLFHHYLNRDHRYLRQWYRRMTGLQVLFALTGGVTGGLLQGGAYLLVVLRAVTGAITIGSVLKYASAIHQFANHLSGFLNMASQFATTCRRQQGTLEFLRIPDVLYKGSLPVEKRDDYEYAIEFRDVSFKYPGSDAYALRHFSAAFTVGKRLAVVGLNGSGKTTMVKLLCRLYDPTEGVILLNGYDIRKYDYQEYQRLFSVVFQDFKLFSLPLGQNVAAAATYDNDRAADCLHRAGFAERLENLARGLETPLYRDYDADGVEISGGEAQKIAIARALYKDAPFVVLDEPTAALDPLAEYEIYTKFNEIVGEKTAVFISHRLSSCRFCDDIAVFHEGRLVQRGRHQELLADTDGQYHALWTAQAQYYAENTKAYIDRYHGV